MNRIASKHHRSAPLGVAGVFVSAALLSVAAAPSRAQSDDPESHAGHTHHAAPSVPREPVAKQFGSLSYSEITATWDGDRFVPSPPYLQEFRLLDPSGPIGSYLLGSYLGSGEMYRHVILFPNARVQYTVKATAGPNDLAIAVAAQWPGFSGPQPDSLSITLTLQIDAADSLAVPVAIRPSRSFFGANGAGRAYSLPQVLVLDLPEGEHTVSVRVSAHPANFALVTAGIPIESDGEASPVPLGSDPSSGAYPKPYGSASGAPSPAPAEGTSDPEPSAP